MRTLIVVSLRNAIPLITLTLSSAVNCAADGPAAWQLALRPNSPAAVFDVDKDAHLTATVRNVTGVGSDAKLTYAITDYDGVMLSSGAMTLSVPPGQTYQTDLLVGQATLLPHEEALGVTVKLIADGNEQAVWRKTLGFLPSRTIETRPETSPFGLLAEGDWPLIQRLGVRYVRPNWSWNERPMDWARRYGVAYCPLINEANAFARGELSEKEYYDFVYESVRRFKGYIRYWQLGNEFDIFHKDGPGTFVESQRIGYAAAKAADPQCVVVGGSITELQCRPEGWAESLQAGLPKYCDVYDFHFYQDLAATQSMLDYIHATCKQYDAQKPVWVTETTQVGMLDPDDRNQAEYIFKRHANLLASGISVVMWHCYRWPYPLETDRIAATGIVDHDGFARPALFAFAALTKAMEGAEFVKRWDAGKDVYAYEFASGERSLLIVWSEGGDRSLQVARPAGDAYVVRPNGKRTVLQATNQDPQQVIASKSPIIYELPGAVGSVTVEN